MAKKIIKNTGFSISLQAGDLLKNLKDSDYWPAIKEYMNGYIQLQKDFAFKLSERDPFFAINHTHFTSKVHALRDFIDYVERAVHRASEEDKNA